MRGLILYLTLCLAVILFAAGVHALRGPAVCYEDEPCWDCATMGNRICGLDGNGHTMYHPAS